MKQMVLIEQVSVLLLPVMLYVAHGMGGVLTGWDRGTFVISFLRTIFAFLLGWGCYRMQAFVTWTAPVWVLAILLGAVVCAPWTPLNWLYDLACVSVVFPLSMCALMPMLRSCACDASAA